MPNVMIVHPWPGCKASETRPSAAPAEVGPGRLKRGSVPLIGADQATLRDHVGAHRLDQRAAPRRRVAKVDFIDREELEDITMRTMAGEGTGRQIGGLEVGIAPHPV